MFRAENEDSVIHASTESLGFSKVRPISNGSAWFGLTKPAFHGSLSGEFRQKERGKDRFLNVIASPLWAG